MASGGGGGGGVVAVWWCLMLLCHTRQVHRIAAMQTTGRPNTPTGPSAPSVPSPNLSPDSPQHSSHPSSNPFPNPSLDPSSSPSLDPSSSPSLDPSSSPSLDPSPKHSLDPSHYTFPSSSDHPPNLFPKPVPNPSLDPSPNSSPKHSPNPSPIPMPSPSTKPYPDSFPSLFPSPSPRPSPIPMPSPSTKPSPNPSSEPDNSTAATPPKKECHRVTVPTHPNWHPLALRKKDKEEMLEAEFELHQSVKNAASSLVFAVETLSNRSLEALLVVTLSANESADVDNSEFRCFDESGENSTLNLTINTVPTTPATTTNPAITTNPATITNPATTTIPATTFNPATSTDPTEPKTQVVIRRIKIQLERERMKVSVTNGDQITETEPGKCPVLSLDFPDLFLQVTCAPGGSCGSMTYCTTQCGSGNIANTARLPVALLSGTQAGEDVLAAEIHFQPPRHGRPWALHLGFYTASRNQEVAEAQIQCNPDYSIDDDLFMLCPGDRQVTSITTSIEHLTTPRSVKLQVGTRWLRASHLTDNSTTVWGQATCLSDLPHTITAVVTCAAPYGDCGSIRPCKTGCQKTRVPKQPKSISLTLQSGQGGGHTTHLLHHPPAHNESWYLAIAFLDLEGNDTGAEFDIYHLPVINASVDRVYIACVRDGQTVTHVADPWTSLHPSRTRSLTIQVGPKWIALYEKTYGQTNIIHQHNCSQDLEGFQELWLGARCAGEHDCGSFSAFCKEEPSVLIWNTTAVAINSEKILPKMVVRMMISQIGLATVLGYLIYRLWLKTFNINMFYYLTPPHRRHPHQP